MKNLRNYLDERSYEPIEYKLAKVLDAIIDKIEQDNLYPNPQALDKIEVWEHSNEKNSPPKFEIQFDDSKEYQNMSELEKIDLIYELILSSYRNSNENDEAVYSKLQGDENIIKEIKDLLRSVKERTGLVSFKYFCTRIKEFYMLFHEKNTFRIGDDSENNSNRNENNYETYAYRNLKYKIEKQKCNFCGFLSLEPIIRFKECDCWFHRGCLETYIMLKCEDEDELKIDCQHQNKHFSTKDLKILVEIKRTRFALSKPIKPMTKFYLIYPYEDGKCGCQNHNKVSRQTKKPYICNGTCTFCGEKSTDGKLCSKFLQAMNCS